MNIKLICDAKDPVAIVVVVVGMEGLEEEVAQVKNISQLKLFGSMHLGVPSTLLGTGCIGKGYKLVPDIQNML